MKIATYLSADGPKTGVVQNDEIIDLESCGFPGDMKSLLQAGIDVEKIAASLESGARIPFRQAELLAPIGNPGKVLALGLNYGDHIAETGSKPPKYQM